MKRRSFLKHATATIAAIIVPVGATAYAEGEAASAKIPAHVPAKAITIRPKYDFTIVSASTQKEVDAEFKQLVEYRARVGERIAVYANQKLSDEITAPKDSKSALWVARNDKFTWFAPEHPIHKNAGMRFWARLRHDPDTFAIARFSDGCRFPWAGKTEL